MGIFSKLKSIIMASRASKIITAVSVVAVLGVGTAGLAYAGVFTGAEAALGVAAVNTFVGNPSSAEEVFGLESLSKALLQQGMEFSTEVSLNEMPLDDFGLAGITLPKTGFRLVTKTNPEEKVNAELDVTLAGTSVLGGTMYADKERVEFAVPKLFESVLALNYGASDIEQQIKASYAAEYLGFTEEEITELVELFQRETETGTEEELRKAMLDIVVSNYELHLGETKLKKAGKEELEEQGYSRKCKVYTLQAEGQNVGEFLNSTHYEIQKYLKESAEKYGVTPEQIEEVFGYAGALVYQLKCWMRGPVTVKFYVCEERLVKVMTDWTMETTTENGTATESGTMEINFAFEGNPLENMTFALHTPVHQDITVTNVPQRIDVEYRAITENTEELYSVNYYIECNDESLVTAFTYNKSDGEVSMEANVNEQSFVMQGVIDKLEKGSSIGLVIENFRYADGESTMEQELEVGFSLKALETEVAPLAGTVQDVLAMTESDFKELEDEISKNVTVLVFSLLGLFQ